MQCQARTLWGPNAWAFARENKMIDIFLLEPTAPVIQFVYLLVIIPSVQQCSNPEETYIYAR